MSRIVATAAAAGFIFAGLALEAQAMPASPLDGPRTPAVTLVRGGCGIGWHPTPWGACRPNLVRRPVRCWWRDTPWGPRRVCRRVW